MITKEKPSMGVFIQLIEPEILSKAVSLEDQLIDEYVWTGSDCLRVLEILAYKRKVILGGDVYALRNYYFVPLGDSWFYDPQKLTPTDEDINQSLLISVNYVKRYIASNGDGYFFSIIVRP